MPDTPNSTRPNLSLTGDRIAARPPGRLALADGSVFQGFAFGAVGRGITAQAEVVFNTAMSGYQESLTDPSYTGQILVETFPLIGNTGVNAEDTESQKVQVSGLVVRELARRYSNYRAQESLSAYLSRSNVLGLEGVDTRAITKRLRSVGCVPGVITDRTDLTDDQLVEIARSAPSMDGQNLVPMVGCTNAQTWAETLGDWTPLPSSAVSPEPRGEGVSPSSSSSSSPPLRVLALDCGAKRNILRNLSDRGCAVEVVPHDTSAREIAQRYNRGEIDGLFVSNGPGDPAAVEATVATLRDLIRPISLDSPTASMPIFGICLGHQLLSLAAGAKTYKLKFGHRGINQPVLNHESGEVEITSQNHGFAVDADSLAAVGGVATHVNLNDGTLAGFRLKNRPVFAVQYHPEASPGPHDAGYLFDEFVALMNVNRRR